jgi:hypothetical protein
VGISLKGKIKFDSFTPGLKFFLSPIPVLYLQLESRMLIENDNNGAFSDKLSDISNYKFKRIK